MNLKPMQVASVLLLALTCLILPQSMTAQSKPRWAQKGVSSMNKARSNDTYEFMSTETFGPDVNVLRRERMIPLLNQIAEKYGLEADKASVDTLGAPEAGGVTDCRITFPAGDTLHVCYARLVDEYEVFDDNADQTYDYTLCQLYAVSRMDVQPVYDDFELTRTYNAEAVALSIVPGMGQMYKGQTVKGAAILGGEAALIAGAVAFSIKKNHSRNHVGQDAGTSDSWHSKERGWRQMRNLCIGLAGGLYVYNLLDAALSKGARQVVVKKKDDPILAVVPVVMTDGAGLSLVLNF